MKDNKMGNIWHDLIKCILYIFIEKSQSDFHSTLSSKTVVRRWESWPKNFA